jgi:RNA polymerase sigma factor (sigma-70 family)
MYHGETGSMEPRDGELLERWRAGDRAAGEMLMRRHYHTVLRFFELNASWAADDLAQRTFMACIERAAEVRDAEAFRAYLLGVARRQLAQHQRENSRTEALRRFGPAPRGVTAQLTTLIARGREQLLVLRALAALPRRAQTLLILYYWDGVDTTELAVSYRVPTSTIRTRLARARDLLRRRMGELAIEPGAVHSDDELRALLTSLLATTDAGHVQGLGKR